MKTHGASPATGRRRSATHSAARVLPLVGAAGILVPITLDVDPIHDIDLFVFEGAWVWATADDVRRLPLGLRRRVRTGSDAVAQAAGGGRRRGDSGGFPQRAQSQSPWRPPGRGRSANRRGARAEVGGRRSRLTPEEEQRGGDGHDRETLQQRALPLLQLLEAHAAWALAHVKRAGRARPAAWARRRAAPHTGMRSGRRSPPSRTGGSLSARVGHAPGVPGGRWRPR
jgi:hypothetical protein